MTLRTEHGVRGDDLLRWSAIAALGVVAPLVAVTRPYLGGVGVLALAIVMASGAAALLGYIVRQGTVPRTSAHLVLGALPLIVLYVASTAANPSTAGITNVVQLLLVVGFTAGLALVRWSRSSLAMLLWVPTLLVVAHVAWWLALGAPRAFAGVFGHPNALGLFALAYGHLAWLLARLSGWRSLRRFIAVSGGASILLLLVASGSRATWLAAATSVCVALLWPSLTRRRGVYHAAFGAIMLVAFAVTVLLLIAPSHAWGMRLQELSVALTGQNLFSGRHLFWDDLWTAIAARPWLGYGAGVTAESVTGYRWSSHNLYLQTALQTGAVGLAALVLFLWSVWAQFRRGRADIGVRIAASCFAGILVHQVFEISLTQNNLATGYLVWLVVAIGIARIQRPAA